MIVFLVPIIVAIFFHLKIFENQEVCFLGIRQNWSLPQGSEIKLVSANKYVKNRTVGVERKIPYFIFQTNQNDYIPIRMSLAVSSILQKNPDFSYRYFNGTERREFIRQYMGETLLKVYDKQVPGASKSNIFRYSIVLYYGGCYMDSGFVVAQSISQLIKENTEYITVRDGLFNKDYDSRVHSAFFCAIPRSPILEAVLNNITRSTAKQDYGTQNLDISGPVKLTFSFLQFMPQVFSQKQVRAGYYRNNKVIVYQSPDFIFGCQTVVFLNQNGQVMISHRYPFYRRQLQALAGPSYAHYYDNRLTYNKSIIIQNIDDFNVSNALIHGLRDYRIPLVIQ